MENEKLLEMMETDIKQLQIDLATMNLKFLKAEADLEAMAEEKNCFRELYKDAAKTIEATSELRKQKSNG